MIVGSFMHAPAEAGSSRSSAFPEPSAVTQLGKRHERSVSAQTPRNGSRLPALSPANKRARFTHTDDSDMDATTTLQTPSPGSGLIAPRTPSPGHQGVNLDQSKTPGVGADFFAPPARFSVPKRQKDGSDEEEETVGLPFPIFATTPRPAEPRSPTLDAPPSASRSRFNASRDAGLVPGRHRASPAPRSVSEAHKELTTITESDEPPLASVRRRVASVDSPQLLAKKIQRGRVGMSPARLSPSPSIGSGEKEAFQYTPFPAVPGARVTPAASRSRGPSETPTDPTEDQEPQDRTERSLTSTPTRRTRSPGPARAYMNVALHGLIGAESPSTLATPGHRTMLGTERYRDTRFSDVPDVQWGTPSVDLGPNTPVTSLSTRRDW